MKRFKSADSAAIVLSLLAHAGVALLFFSSLFLVTPPPEPTPIEVSYAENSSDFAGQKDSARQVSRTRKSTRRSGTPKLSGSQLRPKLTVPTKIETAVVGDLAEGSAEWSSEDWGVGGNNFGEIVNFLSYRKLFDEIDNMLNYPSILVRRNFSGTIHARLAFTEDSHCDWKRIQIKPGQKYLRVYVLALLKKVCTLTVIQTLKADRKRAIDLTFAFDLTERPLYQEEKDKKQFIVGNVLGFNRTEVKSSLEYHIGPIQGFWFVPYVALDFPWIFEKWDTYVNDKDPLEAFRD